MIRRFLIALTLSLSLGGGAAMAQTAAEKATIDVAKAQGIVGEGSNGFLSLVTANGSPSIETAMRDVNAGRAKAYKDIAAKTGVSEEAAGEATAKQLFDRLPSGSYYKPQGGNWIRK
jgi:uncharacterized protein YdbL (DUF1318 family)